MLVEYSVSLGLQLVPHRGSCRIFLGVWERAEKELRVSIGVVSTHSLHWFDEIFIDIPLEVSVAHESCATTASPPRVHSHSHFLLRHQINSDSNRLTMDTFEQPKDEPNFKPPDPKALPTNTRLARHQADSPPTQSKTLQKFEHSLSKTDRSLESSSDEYAK